MARLLGLVRVRVVVDARFLGAVRRLNAEGLPDTDIAGRLGVERHTASKHRKAMGLPSHEKGRVWRERIVAASAAQCRRAGVRSMGELRSAVFAARAVRAGWPADMPPAAVKILDALADHGPMTRPEVATATATRWLGSRKTFKAKLPGGSYFAYLVSRGYVVDLGRVARNGGRGGNSHLYSLAADAERA